MKQINNIRDLVIDIPKEKRVFFISGKVSGLPREDVINKFNTYEAKYAKYSPKAYIINPVKIIDWNTPWVEAMKICKALLPYADLVYFLPDWRESIGAVEEYELAKSLYIRCKQIDIITATGNLNFRDV